MNNNHINIRKKVLVINAILIYAITVFAGIWATALPAFAGGGAGGDDDGGSKSDSGVCKDSAKGDYGTDKKGNVTYYATQYDSCGAAFKLYDVNNTADHPDAAEVSNAVSTCSKFGGKFYFLSLAQVRYSSASDSVTYLGTFKRSRTVSKLKSSYTGGSGNVPYIAKVGLPFDDVKKDHDAAIAYANAHPEQDFSSFLSTAWSDVTWFCWNPEWNNLTLEATSRFGAYSWVSSNESAEKQTTEEDKGVYDSISTDSDKITVNFRHQLGYTPPSDVSGKTFGAAGTDYNVQVTKNGSDVTSQATFTTSKNGNAGINNNVFTANSSTWSPWLGQSSIEVDIPTDPGATVKVCSKITYDPKIIGWKETSSGSNIFEKDDSTTKKQGKMSEACITIKHKKDDDKEEDGGQINFWSSSKVQVNATGDLPNASGESSDKNEKDSERTVTVKVGTDQDKVTVNFSHQMHKNHTARDGSDMPDSGSDDDVWPDDICTTYEVMNDKDSGAPTGQTYCHPADPDDKEVYNKNVEIPTVQGETVRVCSKISYKPRTITLTRTKKTATPLEIVDYEKMTSLTEYPEKVYTKGVGETYEGHDTKDDEGNIIYQLFSPSGISIHQIGEDDDGSPIYNWKGPENDLFGNPLSVKSSGNETIYLPIYKTYYEYSKDEELDDGWSEACIEITKPDDPETPPSVQGPNQGSNSAEFMYTGEDVSMYWDLRAKNYETRRIIGFQQIIFQVNVQQAGSSGITKGNLSAKPSVSTHTGTSSPCTYYGNKLQLRDDLCSPIKSQTYDDGYRQTNATWTQSNSDVYGQAHIPLTVPDYVGDKYCNSAGIQWGYWYGRFGGTGGSPEGWHQYGSSYWTNYDAACRTIVKKPSVSLWNGGIFTEGDITTSVAPRFLNPQFAQSTGDGGSRNNFGSWTEYLGVIHENVSGFATGASLAYSGNSQVPFEILNVSPLTISNRGTAGQSQISSTTTLRDRFNYYLLSDEMSESIGSSLGATTITNETKIYKASGTLNITGDIIVQGNSKSIYQLPQVVIYAPDGIKIASNVKRIDAWLITNGTINTCSTFDTGTVQAYVQDLNNNSTDCAQQLTINGPIIAKSLELNRTAGADPRNYKTNNPAGGALSRDDSGIQYLQSVTGEVFNLSADTYLWAYAQAGRYQSSYTEAYSRELPPRY